MICIMILVIPPLPIASLTQAVLERGVKRVSRLYSRMFRRLTFLFVLQYRPTSHKVQLTFVLRRDVSSCS